MAHRSSGGSHRYPRTSRVNQVVREVLAEELERMSDTDERLSLLTVTGVTVDPDLRHAVVFLSSLGQDAADALEEHRVALQAAVGRQTRMKRTPRLSFEVDPAVVQGEAVEAVLRRLHSEGAGER
ncbi:MAG TPA: 30S ribosome-binding factor RbfA [Acidimicrobiales bacterium]|nr:30S ribosome-binding factor RbfA [Acidimicrobiales bacterium]